MTALIDMVVSVSQTAPEESYGDLMRSVPHWLFEVTLELITAPVAFVIGWLWRQGLLRHLHRDLGALSQGSSVRRGLAPTHARSHRKVRSEVPDCPQHVRSETRVQLRRPSGTTTLGQRTYGRTPARGSASGKAEGA